MTHNIDSYARHKGILVQCFLATHPDGVREYVLIEDGRPVFAHTSIEHLGARIDMLDMVNHFSDLTRGEHDIADR